MQGNHKIFEFAWVETPRGLACLLPEHGKRRWLESRRARYSAGGLVIVGGTVVGVLLMMPNIVWLWPPTFVLMGVMALMFTISQDHARYQRVELTSRGFGVQRVHSRAVGTPRNIEIQTGGSSVGLLEDDPAVEFWAYADIEKMEWVGSKLWWMTMDAGSELDLQGIKFEHQSRLVRELQERWRRARGGLTDTAEEAATQRRSLMKMKPK